MPFRCRGSFIPERWAEEAGIGTDPERGELDAVTGAGVPRHLAPAANVQDGD